MDHKPTAARAAMVRRGRTAGAFRPGSWRSGDLRLRPCGPGAKERLVRRLLASLPGQETGGASRPELGPVSLETTALGQPRLRLKGQPGPAVSFSQAAGCLWAALTCTGQVGVDAALPSEFEEGYPWPEPSDPRSLTGPGP